jgi:hypothetical protein
MHRYTIEKVQTIRRVYTYEVIAPSEEYARIKLKEISPDCMEPELVSEEINLILDENLE